MSIEEMRHALEANGYEFELYKDTVSIFAPNETDVSWDIPLGWKHMGFEDILKTEEAAQAIQVAYKAMTKA